MINNLSNKLHVCMNIKHVSYDFTHPLNYEILSASPAPFHPDRQKQTVFKSSGLCRRQKERTDRFIVFNISVFCMTNVNKSIYHPVSPWYVDTGCVLVTTAITGDTAHGWSLVPGPPHDRMRPYILYLILEIFYPLPLHLVLTDI